MRNMQAGLLVVWMLVSFSSVGRAQEGSPRDAATYEAPLKDEILEALKKRSREALEAVTKEADGISDAERKRRRDLKENRPVLRARLPEGSYPANPQLFQSVFHFEPQAQYLTGTCWSYSGTSFVESEVYRLTGQKIKLSEMYIAYWEYVEKARRFVQMRGESRFEEGSELGAVLRMMDLHGAVPLTAYDGVLAEDGQHNHGRMHEEMRDFLAYIKSSQQWDEAYVVAGIRLILDRTMGPPPDSFSFEGKDYTPNSFYKKILKLNRSDYVEFMSTLRVPFFRQGEFDVPDNWWRDDHYWNVPLADFYLGLKGAITSGYSVGIGGDVSEPGKSFDQDLAFIPSYDIPQEYIDQSSREYRIDNETTGDDHGIHLVGVYRLGEHDWYLIKDSGRSARHGRFDGYYFFRDDFVRLKMLTFLVHKDAVPDLMKRCEEGAATGE